MISWPGIDCFATGGALIGGVATGGALMIGGAFLTSGCNGAGLAISVGTEYEQPGGAALTISGGGGVPISMYTGSGVATVGIG